MWVAVLVAVLPMVAARAALRPRDLDSDFPVDLSGSKPYAASDADVYSLHSQPYFEARPLPPCPQLPPSHVDLDEVLGPWHLALLLLANRSPEGETLLDESMCATVEVVRTNTTMLRLDWLLQQLGLPAGLTDLRLQMSATVLAEPGLWALATPLGGTLVGSVAHAAPQSHMVLSVCGEKQSQAVHVLTILLTRRAPSDLGSLELLRLSALMTRADGFRRVDERLLSWGQC